MTSKKLVGGYAFRADLARARNANKAVRGTLQKILDEKPGPLLLSHYISIAAIALSENLEAITDMERIISEAQNGETKEEQENNQH